MRDEGRTWNYTATLICGQPTQTGGREAILQTPGCIKMLKYRESKFDNSGLSLNIDRQYVPLSESSAQLTNYPVN